LPIVQIDWGGRFVARLSGEDKQYAKAIADLLSLELLDLPVMHKSIIRQGNLTKRSLIGVLAGEPISINGYVVAKATDSHVEIHFLNGKIIDIKGAKPKIHGIEKLPIIDCEKAIIRSGDIRRTEGKPKAHECSGQGAVIIDHCAEDAFEMAKGACVAVTIGDDTTAIAGDILARLSIPVIGIVDGDLDCLSHKTTMRKGSILIRVDQGHDDIIGRRIRQAVFLGNRQASLRPNELFEAVMKIVGNRIVQVERL
jgi:hypothetical protein